MPKYLSLRSKLALLGAACGAFGRGPVFVSVETKSRSSRRSRAAGIYKFYERIEDRSS